MRFAPGEHGIARHRLIHEHNVLDILKDYGTESIVFPEKVETLPDRTICAIYPFIPLKTFQEYFEKIDKMQEWARLGEILKFARSFCQILSEVHLAGVFRSLHRWFF